MTPAEHLDASVERVMRALRATVSTNSEAEEADFAAAVRDQLAQQFQIVACDLDEARVAGRAEARDALRAWLGAV